MSKTKLFAFLFSAVLVIGLVACGLGANGSTAAPSTSLVGDPAAGQSIFAEKCAACHGPDGTGGQGRVLNPAGNTLRGSDTATFNANLIQVITHGRRSMPAWGDTGRLTPQEIADVAAYIMSLNK
jgi:mono/diheme cytochrome c family protein